MSPPQISAGHCSVISCGGARTHTHTLQGVKAVYLQHTVVKVSAVFSWLQPLKPKLLRRIGQKQKYFPAAR